MERFALVTGASGGIGSAIAKQLGEEGYSLILHYYQNKESVTKLARELEGHVQTVLLLQGDLSCKSGVAAFLTKIAVSVDVIVHNSGQSVTGLMTDISDDELERMIYLHITAPYRITKALLPKMIQRKSGQIILISSIWGITGASYEVLYSTVKGAQNTFVKALAKEVARSGIRVNGVAPGAIQTNMLTDYSEEDLMIIKDEIPLGRIGVPEEVAHAVSYLISEKSSYITGQILSVNGGWYT
ncbi:SDR family oxidoreductase [Priestia megaterium]|nr:SDR family oxidoreductase [Priestia megaterium]